MHKPPKLSPGARIAIVAPSFAAAPSAVEEARRTLQALGFVPCICPSCRSAFGYFAGPDKLRAADINRAFADPSIDGIFCLRGGYGAARLLSLLDYAVIGRSPKVFVGYSDVTALHLALQQLCGFITFHGPMVGALSRAADSTVRHLLSLITDPAHPSRCPSLFAGSPDTLFPLSGLLPGFPAAARGRLTGGNLTTLCSLLGTPYMPDLRGKILFLEEIGEQPYRIDRMLTSLLLSGALDNCAGIVLGTFTDCVPHLNAPTHSFSLEAIFQDRLGSSGIPVLTGFPAGHSDPQQTLPLGAQVQLTLSPPSLSLMESVIRSD